MQAAREAGFKSVSVDLIYGLPRQTLNGFRTTLEKTLSLSPDRIALYSYAHLPQIFMPQRRIHDTELPKPEDKLSLMAMAVEMLVDAGYVFIGMDHFARPDDELALAQQAGKLHRNFQGYATHAELDLLAFGVSAIAKVGPVYAQNAKSLDEYYHDIDAGHLPVRRGYRMDVDDQLRRAVIQELMCHFGLNFAAVSQAWDIDFRTYFADALEQLQPLEDAGLLQMDSQQIDVMPKGRLLVRIIAMAFDRHLQADRHLLQVLGALLRGHGHGVEDRFLLLDGGLVFRHRRGGERHVNRGGQRQPGRRHPRSAFIRCFHRLSLVVGICRS